MILAFDIGDLPAEAIMVLVMMVFSFLGWLKNKFIDKPEPPEVPESMEDEAMREIVWRRQMGETGEEARMPWEPEPTPPPTIRFDPPAAPAARTKPPTPPPVPIPPRPVAPTVSAREKQLAEAFEQTMVQPRRRNSHRRQLDRLLRSPSAARDAILLREILGTPVGLRGDQQPEV